MRAIILCAGRGERLRPLTLKRAKPAIEFLNMPMLAFPYFWFEQLDLSDVVFNTHYLPATVQHAATQLVSPETQLHVTHEPELLGSGGGIWNARAHLQDSNQFAVANGDAVVAFKDPHTLENMLAEHKRTGVLATLLVCPHEGVGKTVPGVWLNADSEVVGFGKAAPGPNLVCRHYASFMFISEGVWRYMPSGKSNILYDVFMAAMEGGGKIMAYEDRDLRWFETGNAADYLSATKTCLQYLRTGDDYGQNLRAMLTRFTPDFELFSDLSKMHLCAQAPVAEHVGFCVVGADAKIAEGIQIENSVALPGASVTESLNGEIVI